jgi:hypothetical protein
MKLLLVNDPFSFKVSLQNGVLTYNIVTCQHLQFSRKDYQLRCTLAIVTFGKGIATVVL